LFLHKHPYRPFIPINATKLIVGTLPPPRFSQDKLLERDVDFCYGSRSGLLWPVLDKIFNLNLLFETSKKAIKQRKDFLTQHNIGICDIVESCKREKIDASDLGMQDVKFRNLIGYLQQYLLIDTILFTGGNSKNGPEYFFRKHLKEYHLKLELLCDEAPRIHQFNLDKRSIKTVSLIAPSGSANRAIGSMDNYKQLKQQNPKFNTIDFRVLQYKKYFI
jgi:G:T/U-mismatch repair DNA glycosylase